MTNETQNPSAPGPDAALYARRASSFGAKAGAYAEHRPDYPREAVNWLLEPVAGRSAPKVLDLAAGTGKLTAVLLDMGLDVVAVEPDAGMLDQLRRELPGVPAHRGTAESIPAEDASFDAVLVGQAFHWFDPERALPEIARVLRPGGVLGALWNADDDRVEWVAGLRDLLVSMPTLSRSGDRSKPLMGHEAFGATEERRFIHGQPRTAETLTATVATHSHLLVMDDAERAATLEKVRAYLAARPETAEGEFVLPLVTIAARGVRAED
ncbi:class I SAM-dependent methyltransferase [Streptomyces sp. ICBB 8177]|uniref:class I SAM-dependent methyltransferase n=1 Tax=Streptomyces sp. ICBB 8177 TaxID=563922 RepID=UPI000D67D28A|nr:class I SAM-dependent methyltransferase [Streptomyces sp. ICBB 8177]PWI43540.1 SAM-dependent methyltransferase [Streptomyces sp. ICBB 8177]